MNEWGFGSFTQTIIMMIINCCRGIHQSFQNAILSYLSLQTDHGMYVYTKKKKKKKKKKKGSSSNQEAQRARKRELKINPADRAAWEKWKSPPLPRRKQHPVRWLETKHAWSYVKRYIHPSRTKCQNRLSRKKNCSQTSCRMLPLACSPREVLSNQ